MGKMCLFAMPNNKFIILNPTYTLALFQNKIQNTLHQIYVANLWYMCDCSLYITSSLPNIEPTVPLKCDFTTFVPLLNSTPSSQLPLQSAPTPSLQQALLNSQSLTSISLLPNAPIWGEISAYSLRAFP